jgi:hypothetical protein
MLCLDLNTNINEPLSFGYNSPSKKLGEIAMEQAKFIIKLKNKGLLVGKNSIGPYVGGYTICKPTRVPGNSRKNWASYFGEDDIPCNAPGSSLYPQDGKWIFEVWECIPGPGPGDFQDEFDVLEDAVESVLDYYFGNPSRMNPPEFLKARGKLP